jgi:Putative enzyme of poly-gamma-glutamate biosynthesis (capsule formation)
VTITEASPTPVLTKILIGGDVMLGRGVMIKTFEIDDFSYPFEDVADFLKQNDIVFVNLESPFAENCPKIGLGFKFCADEKMVEGLNYAGVDVVNIANNHTSNFGKDGIEKTKQVLKNAGINYVGLGNFVIKEINGTSFGFLGFDLVDNKFMDKDLRQIKDANDKVDVLIIAVHWGEEYTSVANRLQTKTAEKMVASGADVIAGHHPHWVQNIEKIGDSTVFYSLGNFVFDQMWSEETKKGLLVQLNFDGSKLVNYKESPIYIKEVGQPELVKL